jgi:hypothetical protein
MQTSRSITVALMALFSATASAQTSSSLLTDVARRSSVSISVMQTRPQGVLARNIGFGYGVNAAYLFRLDSAGIVSLRADAGVVGYGDESKRAAISETVGGRIQVNVRTTNYLAPMSIGPQLMWPTGFVRPYVNVGLGGQSFFTESRLESTDDYESFASTTNAHDFSPSWTAGGGVYVPLITAKANVQLDLGVQYLNGGNARYLGPGSIVDLPGGRVSIAAMESATHLVVVRFGARIGL